MADQETEEDGKAPKTGLLITVAIVLGLSLIAAGGGWMVGGVIAPQMDQSESAAAKSAGGDTKKQEDAQDKPRQNLVALEPITTNLSYPSDNWIRIEMSLLFEDQPDNALADRIHQDTLAYLRTVSLQQIEGPRGFQYLRDDLRERVKLRSEGRVNDILLRTFVIE
ncbi:flagellar basal body-associated FliL family protein [Hoeflea sp. YIM 152468]|uniref:flagellar basal body-associated FliL family protein n=1 Tax=Hoeflea sp. YIM 152468 TaxID=3031759 RepID=UPI0023DB42E9|nr:flagellar basal body-associated FliL family protein [Hoeflea sp. YIM 152468]MDF1608860.1 flagellar basal body-associated FliL family protein [Hoeflea sp. YIM 152468]